MHTRSIAVALLLSLAPATFPVQAFAEAAADDALTNSARARYKEGVEAYNRHDYEAARIAFLQSLALKHHPAILLNLAQSCLGGHHPLEAEKRFQEFLEETKNKAGDEKLASQRSEAERGLAEARTKVARIEIVATPGTEIFLDNERLGAAPLQESVVSVEPGAHTMKFKPHGAPAETQSVSALAGEKVVARMNKAAAPAEDERPKKPEKSPKVEPPPPPPPPVEEVPGSAVEASDEPAPPVRTAPAAKAKPSSSGGVFNLDPSWPVWVGAAGTVASIGTGIALMITKSSANSNAQTVTNQIIAEAKSQNVGTLNICNNKQALGQIAGLGNACNILISDQNAANADQAGAYVAFGVAAAFAVGTVIYAVAGPKAATSKKSSASLKILPSFAPNYSGLLLDASF